MSRLDTIESWGVLFESLLKAVLTWLPGKLMKATPSEVLSPVSAATATMTVMRASVSASAIGIENFATELAYKNLGKAIYGTDYALIGTDPVGGVVDGTAYFTGSVESEAVILRSVGILPVTKHFSLEAMLGVAYVDTTYKAAEGLRITIPGSGTETSGSESDSDLTAAYGLGASFQFTDTLAVYGRWERTHDIHTADYLDGAEVGTYFAGLRYAF